MEDLKCKCGNILEEGSMGVLWCPKCGVDWKIPDDKKEDQRYYFKLKLLV